MADFDTLTKDMWEKSFTDTVFYDQPFMRKLMAMKSIDLKGQAIMWAVTKADLSSQVEWYGANDRIQPQRVSTKDTLTMNYKRAREPLLMTKDEYKMTRGMQYTNIDFVKEKVREADMGFRIAMGKALWETAGLGADVSGDQLIGIRSAVTEDATYGGKTRTDLTTNVHLQSASFDATYADQDDARSANIANFRKALRKTAIYANREGIPTDQMLALVGGDIYDSMKGQAESQATYKGENDMLKYGFQSFSLDGVDFVWMTSWDVLGTTDDSVDLTTCFGLFNMRTWKFKFAEGEAFTWGGWEYQGRHIGGVAQYLNMLEVCCALYCMNPRLNFWNTAWSA